ncbi:MAG: DUF4239 domain-containing protein [Ignavibacteriota bacterium]
MSIFLQYHFLVSIFIISAVSIAVFLISLRIIRKKIQQDTLKENHEVAGFIYNAVCIIYAVLIAFVVYASWNSLKETNIIIEQESNHLLDLYYGTKAFPDTIRQEIRTTINDYVNIVTKEEWESMAEGKRSYEAAKVFGKLADIYILIDQSRMPNNSVLSEALKIVNELGEYRRLRLLKSREHIPDIIWMVLLIGSVILIVFTFFFGARNLNHQYFMTAILIFVSVLVLYLIYVLDHPFVGLYRITTDTFEPLISYIRDFKG